MVLLIVTPIIVTALEDLPPSAREKLRLPQTTPDIGSPISHEQLISLGRALSVSNPNEEEGYNDDGSIRQKQTIKKGGYTLNSLLRGTKVYIPPAPPKPEPSPEYLARKARLQALTEEQAYNALIAPSSTHLNPYRPSPIFSDVSHGINNTGADLINGDNNEEDLEFVSPSLVINIFMSILLCGFATFWALKNFQTPAFLSRIFLPSTTTNNTTTILRTTNELPGSKDPAFVLISMLVGLVVGVAETVVYAAYMRKVKQAKSAEKKIKEKKEVIHSSSLTPSDKTAAEGNNDNDSLVLNGDKEEVKIWGKGVNGGMRRRVRERWETTNESLTEN